MTCAAADRAKVLNIYAWAEYFPASLIAKFQAETGIHVNYAVLDSPETAETILSVGHSNYDLVTMNASPELAREIPKGFWKKLDRASLPNARNADPQIMRLLKSVDPGNQYAVPWMWGTTGILYNSDKIKAIMPNAPLDSLDMVFKKEHRREIRRLRHQHAGLMGRYSAHGVAISRPAEPVGRQGGVSMP